MLHMLSLDANSMAAPYNLVVITCASISFLISHEDGLANNYRDAGTCNFACKGETFFVLNPFKDGVLNNDAIYTSPDDVTRHLNLCERPLSQQSPPRAVACSIDGIARDDYRALN